MLGFGMGSMDIIQRIYSRIYILQSMVHKIESIIVLALGSGFSPLSTMVCSGLLTRDTSLNHPEMFCIDAKLNSCK